MKEKQHEEAKELYFQSGFTKAEIAGKVGVNRKTVLFWAQQGNWDQIRQSARNMPSHIAEKCYYLIDHTVNRLLVDSNALFNSPPVTLKDAQTINLLATTIKKLKNRSTVNESMEMFHFFLDDLNKCDPELAAKIAPQIEEYITVRRNVQTTDFVMKEFNHDATLPFPDKQIQEGHADRRDNQELIREIEDYLNARENTAKNIPASDSTIREHEKIEEQNPTTTNP